MQKGLKLDGQMRALAISLGGAVLMAVLAMLIPVAVFETITGATGISEIVPATAAPLGDTARAIIAFLFAAGGFAVLAAFLLRQPMQRTPARTQAEVAVAESADESKASLFETMRQKIADFTASRRNGPVITDLADLPKLRASDAHPDAPPRRPISAHSEFGEVETGAALPLSKIAMPEPISIEVPPAVIIDPEIVEPEKADRAPVMDTRPAVATKHQPAELSESNPDSPSAESVAAMVDRLEAALAKRQSQLSRLETLALNNRTPEPPNAPVVTPAVSSPPIEVVPAQASAVDTADDMDEALRSALETLQRMNARSR